VVTLGAGSDIFALLGLHGTTDRVVDFRDGEDLIDLREIMRGASGGTVTVGANGAGGAAVLFDEDGAGALAARTLLTLDGVSPGQLSVGGDIFLA
jgi:hypothetical protein